MMIDELLMLQNTALFQSRPPCVWIMSNALAPTNVPAIICATSAFSRSLSFASNASSLTSILNTSAESPIGLKNVGVTAFKIATRSVSLKFIPERCLSTDTRGPHCC